MKRAAQDHAASLRSSNPTISTSRTPSRHSAPSRALPRQAPARHVEQRPPRANSSSTLGDGPGSRERLKQPERRWGELLLVNMSWGGE